MSPTWATWQLIKTLSQTKKQKQKRPENIVQWKAMSSFSSTIKRKKEIMDKNILQDGIENIKRMIVISDGFKKSQQ